MSSFPPSSIELETVPCALCGSTESSTFFTGRDRLLRLPGEFPVVKCKRCGLVYTCPRPGPHSLGAYYPPEYGVYAPQGGVAERLRLYHQRVARRLQGVHRPGRLLDIGCGEGTFLSEMQQLGWDVSGLEMDERAAASARRRGLNISTGLIEDADLPPGSFDLITMSHFLEHAADPRQALRQARKWLAAGGRLFLALPNIACWERQLFGEYWAPWDLPRHLYHFSPATLGALVRSEGFEIDSLQTVTGLYIPASVRSWRARNIPPAEGFHTAPETVVAPASSPRELLKTLIFQLTLTLGRAAGRWLPGEVMELILRPCAEEV